MGKTRRGGAVSFRFFQRLFASGLEIVPRTRFGVRALEMTTREVLQGLANVDVHTGFVQGLRRFLDQCDMVKFAKVRPSQEASLAVLRLGRELVEETIPAPPSSEGATADAGGTGVPAGDPDPAHLSPSGRKGDPEAVATPSSPGEDRSVPEGESV